MNRMRRIPWGRSTIVGAAFGIVLAVFELGALFSGVGIESLTNAQFWSVGLKTVLQLVLAIAVGFGIDLYRCAWAAIGELEKHAGEIRALLEDIAEYGSIVRRRGPRSDEKSSYVIASEPHTQPLPVNATKWECVYSMLSRTHGKNLQSLLLSGEYLKFMVRLASSTSQQVRVLVLPDQLRHAFVLEAFYGLSDSLGSLETRWARKSEFHSLVERFSTSVPRADTTWKELRLHEVGIFDPVASKSARAQVLEKTRELLLAQPNLFVGKDQANGGGARLSLPRPEAMWHLQYVSNDGKLTEEEITEWDAANVVHCASVILLAYMHLAVGSNRTKDSIGDISSAENDTVPAFWNETTAAGKTVDLINSLGTV